MAFLVVLDGVIVKLLERGVVGELHTVGPNNPLNAARRSNVVVVEPGARPRCKRASSIHSNIWARE